MEDEKVGAADVGEDVVSPPTETNAVIDLMLALKKALTADKERAAPESTAITKATEK